MVMMFTAEPMVPNCAFLATFWPFSTQIATHDMEMVLDLCDRTIVMKQGRIVADGSTRHVFGDLALLEECGLEQPCELRMKRALKREYAL